MRWIGHMALMGDRRCVCVVLVGDAEEKKIIVDKWRLLKCILKKWDWNDLAQGGDTLRAFVNVVMNLQVL